MPVITEVQFSHVHGALSDTFDARPELGVTVIGERSTDPDHDTYLIQFDSDDTALIEELLTADTSVREATRMTRIKQRNLWSVSFATETELLSPIVTGEGGLVMDARRNSDPEVVGWHERWLVPNPEAVNTIWDQAREAGFDFEICELLSESRIDATHPERHMITDAQREAIKTAYTEGYFSEPRDASLADLADALDQSPSAVGGRVRRGMKTLIARTLVVNDSDQ